MLDVTKKFSGLFLGVLMTLGMASQVQAQIAEECEFCIKLKTGNQKTLRDHVNSLTGSASQVVKKTSLNPFVGVTSTTTIPANPSILQIEDIIALLAVMSESGYFEDGIIKKSEISINATPSASTILEGYGISLNQGASVRHMLFNLFSGYNQDLFSSEFPVHNSADNQVSFEKMLKCLLGYMEPSSSSYRNGQLQQLLQNHDLEHLLEYGSFCL